MESTAKPSGRRLAIAVVVWILSSIGVGLGTAALATSVAPSWAADANNLAIVIVAEVYLLLVGSLLLIVGGSGRAATSLGLRPSTLGGVGLGIGALAAAYAVSAIGYALLHVFVTPDPSAFDIVLGIGSDGGRLADAGVVATLLIVVRILVLVPLGEELLFRGALHSWLRRRLSARMTIGITSALFAVIHQFLIVLPMGFVLGWALGRVRERTGSVIPGVVAHSVNGLLLMVLSYAVSGWSAPLPF